MAWEMRHGEITDDDLTVDHICASSLCVNPEHLRLLPRRANAGRSGGKVKQRRVALTIPSCFDFLRPQLFPSIHPVNGHTVPFDGEYVQPDLWGAL